MNRFREVRQKIAHDFCKSLVVIDDEIYDQDKKIKDIFNDLREKCEESGILNHLFQYTDNNNGNINDRVVNICKSADVIILDWHLKLDTSEDAIAILNELQNEKRIRFIVINSQVDINTIIPEFQQAFPKCKSCNVPDRSPETPAFSSDDEGGELYQEETKSNKSDLKNSYIINDSIFITIRNKEKIPKDAEDLLNIITELLENAFKDYLHWAGLELSVRIRKITSELIANLPRQTNGALLFQTLFQGENEVSQQVCEVLLDEIKEIIADDSLEAVNDQLLFAELKKYAIKSEEMELAAKWKSIKDFSNIRKALNDRDKKTQSSFFGKSGHTGIDTFINSVLNEDLGHKHWANLRESILMMKTNKNLQPGTVLKHKENDNKYYLCITPACDCYRPRNGYLFVIGTELTEDVGSNNYQTKYYTANKHITWDASEFIFEKEIATINENYEIIGHLRFSFINRIIQRIWSYQSRVGIDTSEYIRKKRRE